MLIYRFQMSIESGGSSQAPISSQPEAESRHESINESEAIEIKDEECVEEDGVEVGSKRVRWNGKIKAKCNYCFTKLGGETRAGIRHLHDHLKSCTLRKIKLAGNKTLSQTSLRFSATYAGTTCYLLVCSPGGAGRATGGSYKIRTINPCVYYFAIL
jgi:hypothetical protein